MSKSQPPALIQPTKDQLRRLQKAIAAGYPDHFKLQRMVRDQLDENLLLEDPVYGLSLRETISKLVERYARRPGGLVQLAQAAHKGNPLNAELAAIAAEYAQINFAPLPDPAERLSDLHLEYLRMWFGKPWRYVSLAEISARDERADLLDVYVPLPVDFRVMMRTKKHRIEDWWVHRGDEDPRADHPLPPKQIDESQHEPIEHQRAWSDLGVGESEVQRLIEHIESKIQARRADGNETQDGEHSWYMEAHDAASVQPRFVLLGGPGSGKSSFLRHLTLCLAGEIRSHDEDQGVPAKANLAALRDWLLGSYTPLYIELRELVRTCFPEPTADSPLPDVELLWRYVREKVLSGPLQEFEGELRGHFRDGKAILLLDGLDEVPQAGEEGRRKQIQAFIGSISGAYENLRMVITGRPHAYVRGEWRLDGFGRAELETLDWRRLHELALALFGVVLPDDADQESTAFIQTLQRDPNIEPSLYGNPLFFTLLAAIWLNSEERRLPHSKAELYREAVDLLLGRWTRRRQTELSVAQKIGLADEDLRTFLEHLALQVTEQGEPGTDSTVFGIGVFAETLHLARIPALSFILSDYLTQQVGILISPAPRELTFVHRSFQEHLAACELTSLEAGKRSLLPLKSENCFPQGLVSRVHEQPDLWENVARLAAGELALAERRRDLWVLLREMARPYLQQRGEFARAALLALQIVEEQNLFEQELGEFDEGYSDFRLLKRLAKSTITDVEHFQPEERARVGRLLGSRRGLDDRPGVGLRSDGLPDLDWVKILEKNENGKSEFIYGDGERRREPTFWMARYPVTYLQFQAFVDADDGLGNPRWWTDLETSGSESREPYEQRFQVSNHSRENVTWNQTIAFCRWLTERLKYAPDLLPAEIEDWAAWEITLPTEWQWEKAARGHDGRRYPWGDEYISGYANVDETKDDVGPHNLGQTSSVGIYPQGASPYGVLDMSGNVWEWCLNHYNNPENLAVTGTDRRVLRGGSYFQSGRSASASARGVDVPWGWDSNFGFRCVVVPVSR